MDIYNALQPRVLLTIDETKLNLNEKKRSQAATFKFLHACVNELKFPTDELFIITDLYGDDTTGFVKVSKPHLFLNLLLELPLIRILGHSCCQPCSRYPCA